MIQLQTYPNHTNPDLTATLWQDDDQYIVKSASGIEVRFSSAIEATLFAHTLSHKTNSIATVESGVVMLRARGQATEDSETENQSANNNSCCGGSHF